MWWCCNYNKYFEENKNNCRTIWIDINEIVCPKNEKKLHSPTVLIDGGKTTNPKNTEEHFNEFFTEIGINAQNKISPTRKYYTDNLLNPNNKTYIITPTTNEEISNIILTSTLQEVQDLTTFQQK